MEFQNESWKNHGILFFEIFSHTTFEIFFCALRSQLVIVISYRSWKMQRESWKIHGKIMEFHFGKWLETLIFALYLHLLFVPHIHANILGLSDYQSLKATPGHVVV